MEQNYVNVTLCVANNIVSTETILHAFPLSIKNGILIHAEFAESGVGWDIGDGYCMLPVGERIKQL